MGVVENVGWVLVLVSVLLLRVEIAVCAAMGVMGVENVGWVLVLVSVLLLLIFCLLLLLLLWMMMKMMHAGLRWPVGEGGAGAVVGGGGSERNSVACTANNACTAGSALELGESHQHTVQAAGGQLWCACNERLHAREKKRKCVCEKERHSRWDTVMVRTRS